MTQIKKTLSIAGIIALATAPAMADIASTAYVQSIVNNIDIPTYTAGNGIAITNNAISIADNVLVNNQAPTDGNDAIAIGAGAIADTTDDGSIAIGQGAYSYGYYGTAIGFKTQATGENSTAVGAAAEATVEGAIQLGRGTNNTMNTFSVGLSEYNDDTEKYDINYPLLVAKGLIPAGRLTAPNLNSYGNYASDNNGVRGQLLQTNGDGTMSWVDATASVLPALINDCKVSGQRCALITTWNSTTQKPTYTWEVVKVSE